MQDTGRETGKEGSQADDVSSSPLRWMPVPSSASVHLGMKGKPSPSGSRRHRSKWPPGQRRFQIAHLGVTAACSSCPCRGFRRAPGQGSRGQGEARSGCTYTMLITVMGRDAITDAPLMPPADSLGITPQSIHLGEGS